MITRRRALYNSQTQSLAIVRRRSNCAPLVEVEIEHLSMSECSFSLSLGLGVVAGLCSCRVFLLAAVKIKGSRFARMFTIFNKFCDS